MSTIIIECPNEIYSLEANRSSKVFLAGGITNCPDWQKDLIKFLKEQEVPGVFYNPRRENFPIDNPNAAEEQIVWEYNHLRDANMIVFWFASGTLNPIVLYELGIWGNSSNKPIVIGIDPKYERKLDVMVQTRLARPGVTIVDNFEGFCFEIKSQLVENNFFHNELINHHTKGELK